MVRMRVLVTWVVGGGVPLAGFALDAIIGEQATPGPAIAAHSTGAAESSPGWLAPVALRS